MISNALEGDSWTQKTARVGFPILVEMACLREKITYGDWDKIIVKRKLGHHVFAVQYGHPAGSIGDACMEFEEEYGIEVPPINLLVVNGDTGVPGKGVDKYANAYLRKFVRTKKKWISLSRVEKKALIEQAHNDIFDFKLWPMVLSSFGLKASPRRWSKKAARSASSFRASWSRGSESEEHKQLKRFVLANPHVVGLPRDTAGKEEFKLPSGDEVDVYFPSAKLAVEVKASTARVGEIHRGIFQCIKYRTLVQAMMRHDGKIPEGKSILVLGGAMPKMLLPTLDLLAVPVKAHVRVPKSFRVQAA